MRSFTIIKVYLSALIMAMLFGACVETVESTDVAPPAPIVIDTSVSFEAEIDQLATDVLSPSPIPDGFVDLRKELSNAVFDLRYFSSNNFVGDTLDGYTADRFILSAEAANALKKVESMLEGTRLRLKLFDAYRPQMAVDHFIRWSRDLSDTLMKSQFYPNHNKGSLFKLGYIARKSGHSRGSTVDLTLVREMKDGILEELDMGTPWDLFDPKSNTKSPFITEEQLQNRMHLRTLMMKAGFSPLPEEWWHFSLRNEPFPDTYFNFAIE